MELVIADRINLLNILPAEGNIVTLRVVAGLREALGFSEDDIAAAEIKQDAAGRITWNAAAAVSKDVEVGDTGREIIKAALKKLDDEQKLTAGLVPIWDKFMA